MPNIELSAVLQAGRELCPQSPDPQSQNPDFKRIFSVILTLCDDPTLLFISFHNAT